MALVLQAASRESLAAASARLNAYADAAPAADLRRLGEELFAVTRLLVTQRALRRLLADPSTSEDARRRLVRDLLGRQVSAQALETVEEAVAARWSQPSDLVDAMEVLSRSATLAVAEKDGSLDTVEDELFRFGRILDREPELSGLLSDRATPEDKRLGLLDGLIDAKVSPVTAALLRESLRLPRDRHLDVVAEELSEAAAARRHRSVAHVRTPVGLTEAQEERLTGSLTRLYGRPISLQVELDPSVLGGLVVQVGGELIDGSVAGRLAVARRSLPS